MTCRKIMDALEERWNPSYAMAWDNVGLLVGREEKEIKNLYLGNDIVVMCSINYCFCCN